jgi:hypothetical protein
MSSIERRVPRWVWPLAAALLSLVPVWGVFTTSRIFFVRDLTLHFWSHHLWLRNTLLEGQWPWWDPYFAGGHSGIADSLNHVFLLPMTAIRLLASDVVGFNIWVAASQPLAAVGAYLMLRRDVSQRAALLGASLFALSGAMVSTPNFPNLGYTAALLPWVIWSARRAVEMPGPASTAVLAIVFGTQALCGEPVILGTSAGAAVLMAVFFGEGTRTARLFKVGAALAVGGLLAGVQLLPLADAARDSTRGLRADTGGRLHPVDLISTILAQPFGHFYHSLEPDWWLDALNGQLGPFLYSLYFGVAGVLWAIASLGHPERRIRLFWTIAAVVTLVAAFGDNTAIYPFLREHVPVLRSFRFPIKYFIVTTLAVSALAALGWDVVERRLETSRRLGLAPIAALVLAAGACLVALPAFVAPEFSYEQVLRLAVRVGTYRPVVATETLLARVPPLLLACAGIAAGWALLVLIARRTPHAARLALAALYGLTLADPAIVNIDLNPTTPAALMQEPEWIGVMRSHGDGRVYYGGRWGKPTRPGRMGEPLIDGAEKLVLPAEYDAMEARAIAFHESAISTSGWKVRESISYDMPLLVPRNYILMLRTFARSTPEERFRFIERSGVRYCVLPEPPYEGAPSLADLKYFESMRLYECFPNARRVYFAPRARVVPNLQDQIDLLFAAEYDPETVLLDGAAPPAAGAAGQPAASSFSRIVGETNTLVAIEAHAGSQGGYLVLLDSYNASWNVQVDGERAELLRANALYRAVRLAPGRHTVEFSYVPRALYAGLTASVAGTLLVLGLFAAAARDRRRARRALPLHAAQVDPVVQV